MRERWRVRTGSIDEETDMAYSLRQLSDFEDIRTLKHRYFRGIDTADIDLLRPLFTEDVEIDYRGGSYRAKLTGRENMLEFLANSFHAGALAMHHGHMPEITLVDADMAEGLWYLEDLFIMRDANLKTQGTAIYKDVYRREASGWKIARSEYDRVIELVSPLAPDVNITAHQLAKTGRPMNRLGDISHLVTFD